MGKGGFSAPKQDPIPASSPPVTPDATDAARIKQEEKQRTKKAAGWQSTILAGLGGAGQQKLGGGQ